MGVGWHHNRDCWLRVEPGRLVLRDEKGAEVIFTEDENYTHGSMTFERSNELLQVVGPGSVRRVFASARPEDSILHLVAQINPGGEVYPLESRYRALLRLEPGGVTYFDEQGRSVFFPGGPDSAQARLSLERCRDVRVLSGAGPNQYFAPCGAGRGVLNLVALQDLCGNLMRFGYVAGRLRAVLDSVGRRLEFTYTWQGAIDEIHLEAPSQLEGRVRLTKYEYDEQRQPDPRSRPRRTAG